MPQEVRNEYDSIRAQNINVNLNRGSAIVLNNILVIGCNTFGITITNYTSSSSPLININILGSEDNVFYYYVSQDIFPTGIVPGSTLHFDFTTISHYLQVVINTNIVATLDVYITGTP
jgi:hypothetical protein